MSPTKCAPLMITGRLPNMSTNAIATKPTQHGERRRFQTIFLKNLRMLLQMLLLPVVALAITIMLITFRNSWHDFESSNQRLMERATLATDLVLTQIENSCVQAAYDQSIINLAAADRTSFNMNTLSKVMPVQSYFRAVTGSYQNADYAILYLYNPDYYVAKNSAGSMRASDTPSTYHPYSLLRQIMTLEDVEGWIYDATTNNLYRYVKVYRYQVESGIILLRCNSQLVSSQVMRPQLDYSDQRLLLVDADGNVMQDSSGTARGQHLSSIIPESTLQAAQTSYKESGDTYFVTTRAACIPGWQYILLSNGSNFLGALPRMAAAAAGLLLLLLLICALLAYHTARTICRPYQIIFDLLSSPVEDAAQRYTSQWASYDELGLIYSLIHESKYQTYTMLSRLSAQEQALKQAQRVALQAQINPHFLFNTLESINWKIYEKLPREREITGMLQQLSLLMRLSLQTEEPLTTVSQEISHAKVYLQLQAARFQDMFQVKWNIQDGLDNCPALHLSLQPLLENAISHGIKKLETGGIICVDCSISGDDVLFSVSDNGPGFEPANLERIRRNLVDSRMQSTEHIGLANVNARLQLLFGLEYMLNIESMPFEMTRVSLRVPLSAMQSTHTESEDN